MSEQITGPEAEITAPRFKDFGHYTLWWCVWVGGLSALSYVDTTIYDFWPAKAYQLGLGLTMGLICAVFFTLLQNLANPERKKVSSWCSAIAIYAAVKIGASILLT